MDFRKELEQLINRHSQENGSNTPDFILAEYLHDSLMAFDRAVNARNTWYHPDGRPSPLIDMAQPIAFDAEAPAA